MPPLNVGTLEISKNRPDELWERDTERYQNTWNWMSLAKGGERCGYKIVHLGNKVLPLRKAGQWSNGNIKTQKMARPARLERATCGFVVRRSIQLSYGRSSLFLFPRRKDLHLIGDVVASSE